MLPMPRLIRGSIWKMQKQLEDLDLDCNVICGGGCGGGGGGGDGRSSGGGWRRRC